MKRPNKRANIHDMNKVLRKLEAAGVNTASENIKERGFMVRLMTRRPKQQRAVCR